MTETNLKRTALFSRHQELGARFVPFAGWEMPVQYSGLIPEHQAVRQQAGLFDVSHMGELEVSGADALALLQKITPNDVGGLEVGQAQYTALLTEAGTFVDDLLIYRLEPERFLTVVNAANTAGDLAWMDGHRKGNVELRDVSTDYALVALQGPAAETILSAVLDVDLSTLKSFRFRQVEDGGNRLLVSRTGYTGEDGLEIYLAPAAAVGLWDRILAAGAEHGILPVGLGARDTLRLEAALCLYGQDINTATTAWEAGLNFIVKMDKGEFIGRAALARQKEEGILRRLTGFRLDGRGVARPGHAVLVDGKVVGEVTSGTHSPTLKKSIGLTYLPADRRQEGTPVDVDIRGKRVAGSVVSIPFYRRPRR